MTVHFIVSEHSRLQQPAPLTTPPTYSRPIGALLHPCPFRHSHPARSATPPLEQQRHQCLPLKQENSLIFGPWFPIHVFIQKLHNVTLDHQNTIQLINFSVWTPLKCDQILYLDGALPLKKNKNKIKIITQHYQRLKIQGTAKTRDEYHNSE